MAALALTIAAGCESKKEAVRISFNMLVAVG